MNTIVVLHVAPEKTDFSSSPSKVQSNQKMRFDNHHYVHPESRQSLAMYGPGDVICIKRLNKCA